MEGSAFRRATMDLISEVVAVAGSCEAREEEV